MRQRGASWIEQGIVAACGAVLVLVSCRAPAGQRVVSIGHEGDIASLNPVAAGDPITGSVLGNFYEGLVDLDPDMKVVPRLAVSWSTVADTIWEFQLRPHVKRHDGGMLSVEDVTCSIRQASEDPDSAISERVWVIAGAEAVGPDRVRITTRIPDPLLLSRLARVLIHPCAGQDLASRPVGTGPYAFVRRQGDVIEARAFPEYWGTAPSVQQIRFVVVAPEATLDSVQRRDVDVLRFVQGSLAPRIEAETRARLVKRWGVSSVYLWMNTTPTSPQQNPFADRRVRQALSYALDRGEIVKGLAGMAQALDQFIPSGVLGHASGPPQVSFNLGAAQQLLRDAGYADGFETPLIYSPGSVAEAQSVAAQLASVGIRAKPQEMDWLSRRAGWREARLPLFVASFRFDSGDGAFFLEESVLTRRPGAPRSWNPGYSNARVDALITENLGLASDERRLVHFSRINQLLLEEMPVVPLFVRLDVYAVAEDLEWRPRLDQRILASEMSWRVAR
jgi:peptide/nickel transport system substrate-binding protein